MKRTPLAPPASFPPPSLRLQALQMRRWFASLAILGLSSPASAGNGYSLSFSQPGSVVATRRLYLDPDDLELRRMTSGFTFMMWLRFNDLTASRPAIHWGLGCTSDVSASTNASHIHSAVGL